jgi:hypothetical protein
MSSRDAFETVWTYGVEAMRFNRVYFTIFRAKVWKILIFE